ncbi:MAG TPA: PhaM family polyhydroxyalkanoate granule multifunctional regulatory protein [Burkholderiaceae bacterium]|nr:PhaM family polyhydroxyalkanoate granule multifunctional regulatory protein [Burkholderiaceae bacterium]
MASENHNPFVLPGFGQGGDMAGNPLMASMEMMRHAWENLAKSGGMDASGLAAPMSVEDLDRRISDLRAVENWLRMNLSMLSSTIQGLEVQRATIATLKSFMSAAPGAGAAFGGPSPLDVALGIKPAGEESDGKAAGRRSGAGAKAKRQEASPSGGAEPAGKDDKPASAAGLAEEYTANAASAAQGWWEMLQKQFDALADATTAALKNTQAMQDASMDAAGGASADSSLGKSAQARTDSTARKTSAASSKKAPAKKTAARGTRAKSGGKA